MIDRDAIQRYDDRVLSHQPANLETTDVRVGMFGRARVLRVSRDERPYDEEHDVVVAGGGPAGVLYGCMLAARGHSVLILERNKDLGAGVTWNLSREEFEGFGRTGTFTEEELTEMAVGDFDEGVFRLFDTRGPRPVLSDFHFDDIYNISVDELKFYRPLTSDTTAHIRLGCAAHLDCVSREHAYVSCAGSGGPGVVRGRLFIDARGWASPLAALVHPWRRLESVFNAVGIRTPGYPREITSSGKPIGLTAVTTENEIVIDAGAIQPILMRFSDCSLNGDEDGELLYLFTRTARPAVISPMVDVMLSRLHQIVPGFDERHVFRTYWGHIPAYYPSPPLSPWAVRTSAGDRTLLLGCAGQQLSGLTGSAFGALARNAVRICDAVDKALKRDRLRFHSLRKIDIDPRERICQEVESVFGGVMELDDHESLGTVNRDWVRCMEAAEAIDHDLKNEMFRDKIRFKSLSQLAGIFARDPDLITILLRNNRGFIGTTVWVLLWAYVKLFACEVGLLLTRWRSRYLRGSVGALLRMPLFLFRAMTLYGKGCRLDHRKKRSRRE
jgi:hypothetical protein